MKRVLKWPIPVDDRDHPVGGGPVMHVGTQDGRSDLVTVWTLETDTPVIMSARVYGTGQPVPDNDEPLGSVVVYGGHLVWHAFRSVPKVAS